MAKEAGIAKLRSIASFEPEYGRVFTLTIDWEAGMGRLRSITPFKSLHAGVDRYPDAPEPTYLLVDLHSPSETT